MDAFDWGLNKFFFVLTVVSMYHKGLQLEFTLEKLLENLTVGIS